MLEGHFIDPADAYDRQNTKDFVMLYCPKCKERVEFPVTHSEANGDYYQATNIPVRIATVMKWDKEDVFCEVCKLRLDVEKVIEQPKRIELNVRIDCSNMDSGMDSWYDNNYGKGYD